MRNMKGENWEEEDTSFLSLLSLKDLLFSTVAQNGTFCFLADLYCDSFTFPPRGKVQGYLQFSLDFGLKTVSR